MPTMTRVRRVTALTLAGWVTLLIVVRVWGRALIESGRDLKLDAAPLVGRDEWRVSWRVSGLVIVGVLAVAFGPRLAERLPWRRLVAAAVVATAAWALSLALVEGWSGVVDPVRTPTQYILSVDQVEGPGDFLRTYPERVDDYVAHVRAHPPGMILALWALDQIGLGSPGFVAGLLITGGALAVAGVLLAVREVAGEAVARRAAPFVAFAPAALWIASTYDAFFAAFSSWGIALVVMATSREGRPRVALAVGGGLLLGATVMLSYGLVLVGAVPLAVAIWRRRLGEIVIAGGAAGAVVLAFLIAGWSWWEGLSIARREYAESIASIRPYRYFILANLGALAVALGPAVVVGLTRVHDRGLRGLWLLIAGALVAVVLADVSGLSKGEVERIWLPFTMFLLPAGAALVPARPWLAANVGFAATVQVAIHTVW